MAYINPKDVSSPKKRWSLDLVLFDGGPDSWSLAKGDFDGSPALGIRWNGGDSVASNPQSRGNPTWFILPKEIENCIIEELKKK